MVIGMLPARLFHSPVMCLIPERRPSPMLPQARLVLTGKDCFEVKELGPVRLIRSGLDSKHEWAAGEHVSRRGKATIAGSEGGRRDRWRNSRRDAIQRLAPSPTRHMEWNDAARHRLVLLTLISNLNSGGWVPAGKGQAFFGRPRLAGAAGGAAALTAAWAVWPALRPSPMVLASAERVAA